jgi:S-methylmethionine-dependent homocysteine/selenocysteine methylase
MTDLPIGVYAQGDGDTDNEQGWQFGEEKDKEAAYLLGAKQWREDGAQVIGGCCGTTPSYIQQLSELFHTK